MVRKIVRIRWRGEDASDLEETKNFHVGVSKSRQFVFNACKGKNSLWLFRQTKKGFVFLSPIHFPENYLRCHPNGKVDLNRGVMGKRARWGIQKLEDVTTGSSTESSTSDGYTALSAIPQSFKTISISDIDYSTYRIRSLGSDVSVYLTVATKPSQLEKEGVANNKEERILMCTGSPTPPHQTANFVIETVSTLSLESTDKNHLQEILSSILKKRKQKVTHKGKK